jgi:hypothetical protein
MVVLNAVINRADARYLETMSFFLQFHDAPMKLQRSGLVPAEWLGAPIFITAEKGAALDQSDPEH